MSSTIRGWSRETNRAFISRHPPHNSAERSKCRTRFDDLRPWTRVPFVPASPSGFTSYLNIPKLEGIRGKGSRGLGEVFECPVILRFGGRFLRTGSVMRVNTSLLVHGVQREAAVS
jgi:hypothetical protein